MKQNFPNVLRLVDLVNYQEGAVVSKTLIDKKTGTITLFAFDKGQGLSEHTAPYNALVYIIDGEAQIIIANNPFQLINGEIIVIPANETHAVTAIKQFKMLLIMIRS
jgi:quercetin dioxygenase-like cupin family protein